MNEQAVTIYTYTNQWADAKIVGIGKDDLTGSKDVYIVSHPSFNDNIDFYVEEGVDEKHLNVGNNAFWMMINR